MFTFTSLRSIILKQIISLLIFLFIVPAISFGQSRIIDSLKKELMHAKADTDALELLNNISLAWQAENEYDSVIRYATDAKSLSEELLKKNLTERERERVMGEDGRAIVSIGIVNTYTGNYTEALKNQLAALKIFEQIKDTAAEASCYLNLGGIYFYEGNNEESLVNYLHALEMYKKIGNDYYISQAYLSIGAIYIKRHNYEAALVNMKASLQISKQIGDDAGMANSYNNIGEIYFREGNYTEALKNHLATLKIREALNDRRNIIISLDNVGSDYTALGKHQDAISYLNKALEMVSKTEFTEVKKDIYFSFSEEFRRVNDFSNAYKYLSLYAGLRDSLANEGISRQMAEMKTKYETEKKDREIKLLNKDKEIQSMKIEKQRATGKYLIIGFSLLILFSLIALRLYNQKRKTAFERRVSETELKALRSQMNPHFTFNVLNSIQYYASENDMESVELYLEKFSTLIRMILDQSRSAYISLGQEVRMLKLYLELEEMRFEKKFTYTIDIDPTVNPEKMLLPGMLIQPIVENAIKHGIAHKSGEALVRISFRTKNSALLCEVTDNGIGREEAEKLKGATRHKSASTSITKERIEALAAIFNIQLAYTTEDLYNADGTSSGTRVSIEMPFVTDKA